MSKAKPNKHAASVQTNGQAEHAKKKKKPDKKKTFFYHTKSAVNKEKTKPKTVKRNIMPPTEVQEYSCNWKSLLQVRIIIFTMVKLH